MIQQTSLMAYHDIVKPTLTERELAVYRVILRKGLICIEDVAKTMSYEEHREVYPNHISGRFSSLAKKAMIKDSHKRKRTGRTSHILWEVTTKREQKEILSRRVKGQRDFFED